jgi:uncharacterized protein YuzE
MSAIMTLTSRHSHDDRVQRGAGSALICLDPRDQQLRNVRLDEDIVLDVGADDRVVGIEILDASKRADLQQIATWRLE